MTAAKKRRAAHGPALFDLDPPRPNTLAPRAPRSFWPFEWASIPGILPLSTGGRPGIPNPCDTPPPVVTEGPPAPPLSYEEACAVMRARVEALKAEKGGAR